MAAIYNATASKVLNEREQAKKFSLWDIGTVKEVDTSPAPVDRAGAGANVVISIIKTAATERKEKGNRQDMMRRWEKIKNKIRERKQSIKEEEEPHITASVKNTHTQHTHTHTHTHTKNNT
ncbi:hypothetical protein OUZ56_021921 [Daphnia magna]|uniref:Uncharacterized protein n=1 Tax=Daphnia magna TaxID=35525 RepID=A0ABR0AUT8_9CRUS|nr:hypothetical protein OUZ56_021921 [Daphnia magna]